MNSLDLVFKSGSDTRAVRVVFQNGEPWFVLVDVCTALGIVNSRDVANRINPVDLGVGSTDTNAGMRQVQIVSESGLYQAIMGARPSETTRAFQNWVTKDVLPSIRKTGTYSVPSVLPSVTPAQLALQMAQTLVSLESRTESLEQTVAGMAAKERIDSGQVKSIHGLVGQLAVSIGYRRAWRLFKDRFGLAAYRDLYASQFSEAKRFLELQIEAYCQDQERLVVA